MAYTRRDWIRRLGARSDIAGRLTHLTKRALAGDTVIPAVDVLLGILNDGVLRGSSTSSGFIVGNRRAVCFQESPLHAISQNINYEAAIGGARYDPFGLAFAKDYVYCRGGRPVVHDRTVHAKGYVPPEQ